ncbi:hypothetical protein E4U41_006641 [Claviceps citrina]|nr:hypothetical protein E4U41_006641 [Claviceps citrina]
MDTEMQCDNLAIEPFNHQQDATRRKRPCSRTTRRCRQQRRQGSCTSETQQEFLCRGDLKSGGRWGCGRRFYWLHEFANHLRTPTGRKCIQPLYDEERQMREQWTTVSPTSQQSDDSAISTFSEMPDSCAGDYVNEGSPEQLPQFAFDFSFASLCGAYDSEGSPQLQMDMNIDDMCAGLSTLDTEPTMLGATVPGMSYMAWWQSYMASTSSLNIMGNFASGTL